MPNGSRRLDIIYHIDAAQADQQAEAFNQRQQAREKTLLTDAEVAEQAKGRLIEKNNQARIAAEVKRMEAEEEANRKSRSFLSWFFGKTKENTGATNEGTGAVAKFGAAIGSLQGFTPVLQSFANMWSKVRADAAAAASDIQKMRGEGRELQALRDQMGQTGGGIGHVFSIARETLQTTEQVRQMESAGLGIGELALKTDKDRAEFTKAMIAAGRFQQLEGGDAGAYGQMMGQIALQAKGPIKAEDMEAQAWRLFQIQQPGGFRNMSQAMSQYSKLNGLVQNGIYTPEEAMSLASAYSVSNPEEAATRTEQFTRAVMAGRIKSRGMQVSSDVDLTKTDEYFKQLGIGENDSAIARGKKIAEDLARQKDAAQVKGGQFNAYEYLMTKGFGNAEDRESIMALSGLRNTGRLEKIEAAAKADLERGAIGKRFAERAAKDPFYQGRRVELAEQAATAQQGLEEEPLLLSQKSAFAQLKAEGKISGTFDEWKRVDATMFERGSQDLLHGGYHQQVHGRVREMLSAERKRLGLPQYGGLQWSEYDTFKKSAQEVQAAGGDVTHGAAESLERSAKNLERVTEALERQVNRRPGPPAPMPGRPAAHPVRP